MFNVELEGKTYARHQTHDSNRYRIALIPEGPVGRSFQDFAFRLLARERSNRVHGNFYHFAPDKPIEDTRTVSLNKLNKIMGGAKSFFGGNRKVLDIGSGAGIATAEFKAQYPDSTFVALDIGYGDKLEPLYPDGANYIGGDWNKPPFRDNCFDRILSVESFPKHAEWIWDFKETFKEITRISKEGTIWRGTHFGLDNRERPHENDRVFEMIKNMTSNGWDTYVSNRIFVAKLTNKKEVTHPSGDIA